MNPNQPSLAASGFNTRGHADFDVVIVGAGPAGSSCAAFCSKAGLRTLVIEKTRFPREKVCGDCLNPGCWPILERLEVSAKLLSSPHSRITEVKFVDRKGTTTPVVLPVDGFGEVSMKRSILDKVLLDRAVECGAVALEGETVFRLSERWKIHAGEKVFTAKVLVAADGRNSTVARLLGLAPALRRDRVAMQTHLQIPSHGATQQIQMRQLEGGYCGIADVGGGQLNVCLVGWPEDISRLKQWARDTYAISAQQPWRTITPLVRAPLTPCYRQLLLVGDAARVLEPFTGEGIYYALASGELAAKAIIQAFGTKDFQFEEYRKEHSRIYRGRLWVNRLAKAAMVHRRVGDLFFALARIQPNLLRYLTSKVIRRS